MRAVVVGAGLALIVVASARGTRAQLPLEPTKVSGQTVTPAFEGWYRNPDGTYSISFGYYNRNSGEVIEIPVGPDNFVTPGDSNQGQPTIFQPRRQWGVFAIRVPADFGSRKILWTLRIRGQTFAIPGSLHPDWQIDALEGEAGSGNTPPVIRFEEAGPMGQGPAGIMYGSTLTVVVSQPLRLAVWATDDGKASGSIASAGRENVPVTLTWFRHQGPGPIRFAPPNPRVDRANGKAETTATFDTPGEYVLRVRANDASGVAGAGHAQCCWTNGYVRVTVSP